MLAQKLSAKPVQAQIYQDLAKRLAKLKSLNTAPSLVLIQIGHDVASTIYLKHKVKACTKLGIISQIVNLPADVSYNELKQVIIKHNIDPAVHGILIQLPLPKHLKTTQILSLINPQKDVDGLHPLNQGLSLIHDSGFFPKSCTPQGIMTLLDFYQIPLIGKNVVIIGRSNIVGKPLHSLMLNHNAAVINLHTKVLPEDFRRYVKQADILIMAAGFKDLVTPTMVKKGVVIIDVGIHRNDHGQLRGDLATEDFMDVARAITPVPGGVGPMTVTMLLANVVSLAEHYAKPI